MSAGCASLVPGFRGSGASWDETLSAARAQAGAGQFESADSLLARYATSHQGSPEALETSYWRALFHLDPSNRAASTTQALASLDGYLADKRPREHLVEATTLRRVAAQLDALNRLAANASTQAKDAASAAANAKAVAADAKSDARSADATVAAVADAKDAEIKRLRDDLAKANAELERIRKRLGGPPSRP